MKVSEYRDMIDALSDSFGELRSRPRGDIPERCRWMASVQNDMQALADAICSRAKADDHARAERLIARVGAYLSEYCL